MKNPSNYSTEITYKNYVIMEYPRKNFFQFQHKDIDGADDSNDKRYGSANSLQQAMEEIDIIEEELAEARAERKLNPAQQFVKEVNGFFPGTFPTKEQMDIEAIEGDVNTFQNREEDI